MPGVDVSAVAVGDFLHYDIKGANAAGTNQYLLAQEWLAWNDLIDNCLMQKMKMWKKQHKYSCYW